MGPGPQGRPCTPTVSGARLLGAAGQTHSGGRGRRMNVSGGRDPEGGRVRSGGVGCGRRALALAWPLQGAKAPPVPSRAAFVRRPWWSLSARRAACTSSLTG